MLVGITVRKLANLLISTVINVEKNNNPMGFTYDFSLIGGVCVLSVMGPIRYYFRNSSAIINDITNVNYDIDLYIFV